MNGKGSDFLDRGLGGETTKAAADGGKIEVPPLRNVAVTGSYMHNGVVSRLRTAVPFHNRFSDPLAAVNPETGQPWAQPKLPLPGSEAALRLAPALSDGDGDALVAFLKALTDKGYAGLVD